MKIICCLRQIIVTRYILFRQLHKCLIIIPIMSAVITTTKTITIMMVQIIVVIIVVAVVIIILIATQFNLTICYFHHLCNWLKWPHTSVRLIYLQINSTQRYTPILLWSASLEYGTPLYLFIQYHHTVSVSYTHLDVYKRQIFIAYIIPHCYLWVIITHCIINNSFGVNVSKIVILMKKFYFVFCIIITMYYVS